MSEVEFKAGDEIFVNKMEDGPHHGYTTDGIAENMDVMPVRRAVRYREVLEEPKGFNANPCGAV